MLGTMRCVSVSNLESALNLLVSATLARWISLTGKGRAARGVQWAFPALALQEAAGFPFCAPGLEQELSSLPGRAELLPETPGHGRAWTTPCDDVWEPLCSIPCAQQQIFPSVASFVAFIQRNFGFTDRYWIYRFQVKSEACVFPGQPENKQTNRCFSSKQNFLKNKKTCIKKNPE